MAAGQRVPGLVTEDLPVDLPKFSMQASTITWGNLFIYKL